MKAFLALFRQRWVLGLIGVILLALVVWFIGPYVAVGPFVPLESALVRGLTIAGIVLIWAGFTLLRWYRARRASQRLGAAIAASDSTVDEAEAELRRRFEEAIAFLRKSKGSRNLYELPWYVIVGPPGSGKTTALIHSGLNFPLDQKFGRDAVRGVGGTRNCDWWFTDEAVLLDTAGRYFTQDSDADSDAAEWRSFVELLCRYRKRRPINGVLVTLSATDLLSGTPHALERHVATVRRRVDELQRHLKIQVPIYFLVTKCDLVSGFVEFFDDLGHEGRAQVWGMTRPEPVAGADAAEWFDAEYARLLERLNARLLARLDQEREPQRRARLFGFPRQMAGLRENLLDFVRQAFQGSGYDRPVMLRGIYFTSGTQEGTPIDRIMDSLSRSYGLTTPAESGVTQAAGGQGRSYFIHRLLREVIFPEAGLAGVNWRLEVGRAVAQNAAYAAGVAALGLLVAGWMASYQNNQGYLADVSAALEAHGDTATGVVPADADLLDVLPRLDALGEVADEANRYRDGRPFLMGLGLYRGDTMAETANEAYFHGVRELLVPRVVLLLEERLRSPATPATDVYAYLKGYLMLARPQRLERDELNGIVRATLLREFPERHAMARALAHHFRVYSGSDRSLPGLEADADLVARARATLAEASIPALMLSRLQRVYGRDHPAALRLDVQAGLGGDQVFRRRSGTPLAEPVPALYTREGFETITGDVGLDLVEQFQRDRWVFGEDVLPSGRTARLSLAADFVRHYEEAYIAFWEELIADLDLAPLLEVDQAVDMLAAVTGSTSPLRRLVRTISDQLHFPEPDDDSAASGRLDALLDFAEEARSDDAGPRPGERIHQHFSEFNTFVRGADGAEPPLENVIALLDQLYEELSGLGSGLGDQDAMTLLGREGGDALRRVRSEAARQPQPFRAWLERLAGSGQDVALRSLRGQLNRRYRNEVLPVCEELASGRYPFIAGSDREVPLQDFARLFGPGGVIDSFFREHLAELVNASGPRWRWRSGEAESMGIPQSVLDAFQRARLIRDVFFADGSGPQTTFELIPQYLDARARLFRIAIGEQALTYRHGPPVGERFSWPQDTGRTAVVAFEDRAGNRPNATYTGPWSWWRALDAAEPAAQSNTTFLASFSVDGYAARVKVAFDSSRNPLRSTQWREFRCPGGL